MIPDRDVRGIDLLKKTMGTGLCFVRVNLNKFRVVLVADAWFANAANRKSNSLT